MATKKVVAQSSSRKKPQSQVEPLVPSRIKELNGLSDTELKERYVATFAKDPEEATTRDQMVAAINDAAPKPPPPVIDPEETEEQGGKIYGNKDKQKRYPIDETWKKKVIVRQVKVEANNGGMVEVPNTEQVQTYDPVYYDTLIKNNFFGESKMKVEVLHQPAK
jgi:hypothetical protein